MRFGGKATKFRLNETVYHGWTQLLYGTHVIGEVELSSTKPTSWTYYLTYQIFLRSDHSGRLFSPWKDSPI